MNLLGNQPSNISAQGAAACLPDRSIDLVIHSHSSCCCVGPCLLCWWQASGFRRFDAPEEVARWFGDKLGDSQPKKPQPQPQQEAPASSSSNKRSFAAALPRVRYYTMQAEAWKTPKVSVSQSLLPTPRHEAIFDLIVALIYLNVLTSIDLPPTTQDGRFPVPGPDAFATLRLAAAPSEGDAATAAAAAGAAPGNGRRGRRRRPWVGQQGRLVIDGGGGGGGEPEGKATLPVHIHRARVSKGVSRYRAMTHVMLPVRSSAGLVQKQLNGGSIRRLDRG